MKKLTITINTDSFLRILAFVGFFCMSIISSVFASLGLGGTVRTALMFLICYFPVLVLLLKSFSGGMRKFPYDFLIVVAALFLFLFVSLIKNDWNNDLKDIFFNNVLSPFRGVIAYLFARLLLTSEERRKALLISAVIIFAYYGFQGIEAIVNGGWTIDINGVSVKRGYNMQFGYSILYSTLIFGVYGLREKNKLLITLFIVGLFSDLMLGSRASAVSAMLFVLLYFAFIGFKRMNKTRRMVFFAFFVVLIVLFVVFWRDILLAFADIFADIGFDSRTITRILDGSLVDDETRSLMYRKGVDYIKDNLLSGGGFLIDRVVFGNYIHNIFLELWLDFGVIFGTVILGAIVYAVYKMLKSVSIEWKGIFIAFLGMTLLRLNVSYSLWEDMNFWAMIGFFVSYQTEKRSGSISNDRIKAKE